MLKNNNHEFVFIDSQNSTFPKNNNDVNGLREEFKGLAEDVENDLYVTTTGSGVIRESINLIQNYVDFEESKGTIGLASQF